MEGERSRDRWQPVHQTMISSKDPLVIHTPGPEITLSTIDDLRGNVHVVWPPGLQVILPSDR
jgi:hypothetical protein